MIIGNPVARAILRDAVLWTASQDEVHRSDPSW
jgi:hypothetical protein